MAVGRKTFPTLSALQILPKTITSPHFPLSKAPDLDITNSNLGDPVICQYSNFNLGNIILTRFANKHPTVGELGPSWSKYLGNTILTSKLAKFNSGELKAYSQLGGHGTSKWTCISACLWFSENGWWLQGREYGTKTSTFPIKASAVFVTIFSMIYN